MNEIYNLSSFFNQNFKTGELMLSKPNFINVNSSDELTNFIQLNETTITYNISNVSLIDWRDTYKPILDFLLLGNFNRCDAVYGM